MTRTPSFLLAALCSATAGMSHAQALPAHQSGNAWFTSAAVDLAAKVAPAPPERARNVILFVGDGMGVSTLTAARILEGQRRGESGEENRLSFERFPYTALVKTYNIDAQVADSAGTMTAMMSGVKTDAGVLGVNEDVVRGDCATGEPNAVPSAVELAELAGIATGVISTARLTHATPAATYSMSVDRGWEDDSQVPADALAAGCEDIASQFVSFESRMNARHGTTIDGIEITMAGGRRHFLPNVAEANSGDADNAIEGRRTDGRNLVSEWQTAHPTGSYVSGQSDFDALGDTYSGPVLALFGESHMKYEADRSTDGLGEPTLAAMTRKAIALLEDDPEGYLLVVEAGRIDHAHHAGNAAGALTDTIALSDAVRAADEATSDQDTLILVTADHSHVMTIAGYPKRGNPILGKVVNKDGRLATDENDLPYTTLGYHNGLGFIDLGEETDSSKSYVNDPVAGRQDLSSVDTTRPGFHQEALVPLQAETHGGEDVALHARGPGADRVHGVIEQNVVFHVIDRALGLSAAAKEVRP